MIRILFSISFFIFFDSFSQSDKEIENRTIETIQRNWDTFFSMLSIPNVGYYTDDIYTQYIVQITMQKIKKS